MSLQLSVNGSMGHYSSPALAQPFVIVFLSHEVFSQALIIHLAWEGFNVVSFKSTFTLSTDFHSFNWAETLSVYQLLNSVLTHSLS